MHTEFKRYSRKSQKIKSVQKMVIFWTPHSNKKHIHNNLHMFFLVFIPFILTNGIIFGQLHVSFLNFILSYFLCLICSIIHTKGINPKNVNEKSRNKIIIGLIGKLVMSIYNVYVIPDIATIRLTITMIRVPIFFFIVH